MGSGLTVEVVNDDRDSRNFALRVEYDGYGSSTVAQQVLTLKPGAYVFSAAHRIESNAGLASLWWRLACIEDRTQLLEASATGTGAATSASWSAARVEFTVPEEGCMVQRLSLAPRPADRRAPIIAWFDDVHFSGEPGTQPQDQGALSAR